MKMLLFFYYEMKQQIYHMLTKTTNLRNIDRFKNHTNYLHTDHRAKDQWCESSAAKARAETSPLCGGDSSTAAPEAFRTLSGT